jgi:hypothetical protein
MICARLDEQHRYRGVGRKSIRQHTAGGARSDNDVVKSRHQGRTLVTEQNFTAIPIVDEHHRNHALS